MCINGLVCKAACKAYDGSQLAVAAVAAMEGVPLSTFRWPGLRRRRRAPEVGAASHLIRCNGPSAQLVGLQASECYGGLATLGHPCAVEVPPETVDVRRIK